MPTYKRMNKIPLLQRGERMQMDGRLWAVPGVARWPGLLRGQMMYFLACSDGILFQDGYRYLPTNQNRPKRHLTPWSELNWGKFKLAVMAEIFDPPYSHSRLYRIMPKHLPDAITDTVLALRFCEDQRKNPGTVHTRVTLNRDDTRLLEQSMGWLREKMEEEGTSKGMWMLKFLQQVAKQALARDLGPWETSASRCTSPLRVIRV